MSGEETAQNHREPQAQVRERTLRQFRRSSNEPLTQGLLQAVLTFRLQRSQDGADLPAAPIAPPRLPAKGTPPGGVLLAVPKLPQVLSEIEHLPTLPKVAIDLLNYLEREEIDARQLAVKLARDPALSARVLRIANSSFYGLQGQVNTIADALVILGLRAVRTLITATAMAAHLKTIGGEQALFWVHSSGTALCARALAQRVEVTPEAAFTAGLLHDLGRLIFVVRFAPAYSAVIAYRAEHDGYMIDAEKTLFGFDHTEVGAALANRWKFPADTVAAIAGHHHPGEQPGDPMVPLIHVADVMAHALGFCADEADLIPRLSLAAWQALGLDWEQFGEVLREVNAQRQEADWLLQ